MIRAAGKLRLARNILLGMAGLVVLGLVGISIAIRIGFNTGGDMMGAVQKTAISKDGTVIAYEQSGSGPTLILVSAALADRSGNRRLARHLFGSSSGSVLALDAAARLGPKVRKLYMFEPPFIVDSSRPPMDTTLSSAIDRQISNGNRGEAVRMFFTRGMGIPPFGVTMMRFLMPGWSKMCAMAHTIPYDLAILNGTQAGMRLPDARWKSASLPIKVAVGSKSEPFFHSGAKGLVQILPSAEYQSLAGLNHGALLFAPAALGRDVQDFLLRH